MDTVTATSRGTRRARPLWKERRLTLEEFLKLPEVKPALEFEDGVVTQKMSPRARHSALQGEFADTINRQFRRRKVAFAFPELRVTVGGQSYVPDVSIFLWERIARTADGKLADDVFTPPDVAVEIVSPKQSVTALVRRCLRYIALGVKAVLLVDPDDESVLLFRPGVDAVALRGSSRIELDDLLPGLRLTVADLFRSLQVD